MNKIKIKEIQNLEKELSKELKLLEKEGFKLISRYFTLNNVKLKDISLAPQLFKNSTMPNWSNEGETSETERMIEKYFPERRNISDILPLNYKGLVGVRKASKREIKMSAASELFLNREFGMGLEKKEKNPTAILWFSSNFLTPFISHYNQKLVKKYPQLKELNSIGITKGFKDRRISAGLADNMISSLPEYKSGIEEKSQMVDCFIISPKESIKTIDKKLELLLKMKDLILDNYQLFKEHNISYICFGSPLDTFKIESFINNITDKK